MIGFGSLGNGGLSPSSSNLSALAPPFTVDRSNPKPNSNPLVNFTESPYALPFNSSSFHNWQYSNTSASGPDLYSNLASEVDSIRTSDYRYLGSHSTGTHMPPLNPNVSAATDTFTFLPYSSDVPRNHVEAKPYYPSFVSPVVNDDVPLVALNEANYDLLSTTHVAPLDVSSQVDYTQSLSGLEYTPQWGSLWNGLADGEQGKRVELDGSFGSKEINVPGSYVCKNYTKQGACTIEGSSKCEEASAVQHRKWINLWGRDSQIASPSTGKLNDKSSSLQDPGFIFSASPRTSTSGSSTHPESQAQVPSPESATNFWNRQKPYSAAYDKCFQPHDSYMTDNFISIKKSSPVLVIRQPSIGTCSTVPTVSSEDANSIANGASINSKDFGCHYPSNQKEPHFQPSFGIEGCLDINRPNLHGERSDHYFVASSSTREDELSNKPVSKDVLDHMFKAGMEFQLPDINVPDGFTLALDSAKGFTSVEDASESLDHYNPAEDSPCWKGAPASRLSLSEVSEVITTQHLRKKLEACNSMNLQQTQISPCTYDTITVSCQNQCESNMYQKNGYVELDSLLFPERLSNADCPAREHSSTDAVKAGFNYSTLSYSNGVQFSNDIDKPRKEYDVPNDSRNDPDVKPSHTKQPGLDKEEVNKLAKLHATEPTPKMNVQMLVNTIHNLSELLLCHCSNDVSAVSEHDHDALKHVINNLDACVSKKNVHMTPARESMFPREGNSQKCRKLPDLDKGVIVGRPPVTKEANAISHGQHDQCCVHEGKKKSINLSGKDFEKFPDFVSLRDDADIVKDDNMVQAIKEVLKEDFNGEEETESETLLYKNLWLEAEAALCTTTYRARFNRMKIEMEKCKSHNPKDVVETTEAVEKLPRLMSDNPIRDSSISNVVETTEAVEKLPRPMSDNPIRDSPVSNVIETTEAVEKLLRLMSDNPVWDSPISNVVETTKAVDKLPRPMVSPDLHITGKVTPEAKGSLISDNRIQDSTISNVIDTTEAVNKLPRPMVSADLHTTRKVTPEAKDVVETTEAVDKLPRPMVSPDLHTTRKVTPEAKGCLISDNRIQDSRISSTTKIVDDVEASVMARLHILKCRGENSNSVNRESRPLEVVDAGFAGRRNHWPYIGDRSEDGSLDISDGPHSQYCSGNSNVDKFGSYIDCSEHETLKEFRAYGTDDRVIQAGRNNRLGSQLPSGWYDNSSSDWEHVMKDEYACQN